MDLSRRLTDVINVTWRRTGFTVLMCMRLKSNNESKLTIFILIIIESKYTFV